MHQGIIFFCISLVATLLRPWVTSVPLLTFAPFIVFYLMHAPLKSALWKAALVGLLLDCLNSSLPFGFYASAHMICCLILYKKRAILIGDKPFSLALFTFGFSIIFTLLEHGFLSFAKTKLIFSYQALATEFIIMPLCDAAYAFVFFSLPAMIFSTIKRLGLKT